MGWSTSTCTFFFCTKAQLSFLQNLAPTIELFKTFQIHYHLLNHNERTNFFLWRNKLVLSLWLRQLSSVSITEDWAPFVWRTFIFLSIVCLRIFRPFVLMQTVRMKYRYMYLFKVCKIGRSGKRAGKCQEEHEVHVQVNEEEVNSSEA